MAFFQKFPKTSYDFQLDGIRTSIVDIFRYVDVVDDLINNFTGYQFIDIPDGYRPDQLSLQLYGTTDHYWTFFVLNDTFKGGLSSWPKGANELDETIDDYYGNLHAFSIPPSIDPLDSDILYGLDGIPINDAAYKDKLYFLNDSQYDSDGSGGACYRAYKISHYDPQNYLLWVKKDIMYKYTVGADSDAAIVDNIVSTVPESSRSTWESSFFFDTGTTNYQDYDIRFNTGVDDSVYGVIDSQNTNTADSDDTTRTAWINAVYDTIHIDPTDRDISSVSNEIIITDDDVDSDTDTVTLTTEAVSGGRYKISYVSGAVSLMTAEPNGSSRLGRWNVGGTEGSPTWGDNTTFITGDSDAQVDDIESTFAGYNQIYTADSDTITLSLIDIPGSYGDNSVRQRPLTIKIEDVRYADSDDTPDVKEQRINARAYFNWKVSKNAPYEYFQSIDSQDYITSAYEELIEDSQYNTTYRSTNYKTIEEHLVSVNDDRRKIKVVRPEYINQFTEEFENLINL